jgi:hypothetical protein
LIIPKLKWNNPLKFNVLIKETSLKNIWQDCQGK